jgi:hypothetical protein
MSCLKCKTYVMTCNENLTASRVRVRADRRVGPTRFTGTQPMGLRLSAFGRSAGLETRDTAGLETCATGRGGCEKTAAVCWNSINHSKRREAKEARYS